MRVNEREETFVYRPVNVPKENISTGPVDQIHMSGTRLLSDKLCIFKIILYFNIAFNFHYKFQFHLKIFIICLIFYFVKFSTLYSLVSVLFLVLVNKV